MITSLCTWLEMLARVKPSHAHFHLILKTVLGGSNTIYTDDEGAEAQRGEMTSPRSPSYRKAESGLSLHLLLSNFVLHMMSIPPIDGVPLLHGRLILKEFAQ